MTRAQALARDPSATPLPGTRVVRHLPENDDEMRRLFAHSINTGGPRSR